MANYQNQYAATPQIVDPSYPLSQIDEAPQHYVAEDEGKTEGKGLKEKIKEKQPGHHKDKASATTAGSATTAASSGEEKGFMDKVKEKLPGLHH